MFLHDGDQFYQCVVGALANKRMELYALEICLHLLWQGPVDEAVGDQCFKLHVVNALATYLLVT